MKPLVTTLASLLTAACTIPNPNFVSRGPDSGADQQTGASGGSGGIAAAGGSGSPGASGGAAGAGPDTAGTTLDAATAGSDANAEDASTAPKTYYEIVRSTPGLVGYWRMGVEPFVLDDCDGSAGASWQSRPVNGHSWASFVGEGPGSQSAVFTSEGRLRKGGTGNRAHYHSSWVPTSADYAVEADLHVKTVVDEVSLVVRQNLASNNGLDWYAARYSKTGWEIRRVINNVATTIGSATTPVLAAGSTSRFRLEVVGVSPVVIRAYSNGALVASASDSTASRLMAPGRPGLRFGAVTSADAITDTTGLHVDNVRVVASSSMGGALPDSTGMNPGVYTGSPSCNVVGALVGDTNAATRFRVGGDFASVPDSPSLDLGDGPFTLEAWVRRNDSATGLRTIMQKGLKAYQFAFADNKVGLYSYTGGEQRIPVVESMALTSGGAYHHFVVTKNGRAVTLFVDGVSAVGSVGSQTLSDNDSPLVIGGTSSGDFLSADFDEVAVYKVVLAPTAINEHFRIGAGR